MVTRNVRVTRTLEAERSGRITGMNIFYDKIPSFLLVRSKMNGVRSSSTAAGVRHCIHKLARKAKQKVPGSTNDRKLWRHYCHRFAQDVQQELRLATKDKVNRRAAQELEFALGATGASRGIMPDFSNLSALRGYSLQHFGRVRMLGDLLTQTQPDWLARGVNALFPRGCDGSEQQQSNQQSSFRDINLVSLGGGPGYDYVAAVALSEYRSGPKIKARVLEYEEQWEKCVSSMEAATRSILKRDRHCLNFGKCDITLPLSHVANSDLVQPDNLQGDIFSCSYCLAENAVALQKENWIFFRDLFHHASHGALFLVTDTTHRLWPELANVAKDAGLRFATPYLKNGKVGWQFVALKDDSHRPGEVYYSTAISRDVLARFEADNAAHLKRLERGWMPQERKIRGGK